MCCARVCISGFLDCNVHVQRCRLRCPKSPGRFAVGVHVCLRAQARRLRFVQRIRWRVLMRTLPRDGYFRSGLFPGSCDDELWSSEFPPFPSPRPPQPPHSPISRTVRARTLGGFVGRRFHIPSYDPKPSQAPEFQGSGPWAT